MDSSVLRFGPFQLDVTTGELRQAGDPVKLPPQPARVLTILARNPGRLVTRDAIRSEIWQKDTFVDFEQGLNYCIKQIRAALADDARAPKYVETLQRRGYRFIAPVEPDAVPEKVIIAVVPFENLSGDPEQEYFSDGLTDELISQLGRLNPQRLGVVGRTSAMRYKASPRTIGEIGRELGVSYLLEGSVRRSADRVRVTARLVQIVDQTHVWTQSYDRTFDDILGMQRDIGRAIAAEIDVQLTPREAARLAAAVSPEAHEAYLRGRYFWNQRTSEAFKKSIECFHQAIAHEPAYAVAYDGLCDCYVMLACRGVLPVTQTFEKAKEAARRALAIDPTLGEACASLAHVRLHAWEWGGLDADFQRALELSPAHAFTYYWYAEYLMAIGRPEDAIAMVRTARSMDPLSAVMNASVGMILYLARRFTESIDALQKGLELNPHHFLLPFRLGLVYQQASPLEAIAWMQRAVELSGRSIETLAGLAQAYAAAGRTDAMRNVLDEINGQTERYVSPYNVAKVYAAHREPDRVFEWLNLAVAERNPDLIELRTDPVFDSVRADSRFSDFLHRVGRDS
jgi:TolB-like protein/Tfp pilus assembly protein PilF